MADYKETESKISEKLESFSDVPPSKIWKRIRYDLDKPSTIQRFYQNKNLFYSSIAAVFIGLIIGYFTLIENTTNEHQYNPRKGQLSLIDSEEKAVSDKQSKNNSIRSSGQNRNPNKINNKNIEKTAVSANQKKTSSPKNIEQHNIYKTGDNSQTTGHSEETVKTATHQKTKDKQKTSKQQPKTGLVKSREQQKTPIQDNIDVILTPATTNIDIAENDDQKLELSRNSSLYLDSVNDYKPPKPYSLGIYFNTDYIYNTVDALDGFSEAYGFGLAGRYHLSEQCFFESGLGFYQSKDGWDYIIDYRSKELKGYYQNVDSISYQIVQNSSGQDSVVVQYHTHQEAVYDSVDKTMHDITTRHYTYLSIPLLIGYKNNLKRFQYSLSTGLAFSLEMHEKIEKNELEEPNITVVNTQYNYQNRLNTNWHYILNLGIGYQFDHRWLMIIEPGLRVYLKQIYGSSDVIKRPKPYAIRLRAGVFYRF
ncbi:MAG: PorT family protein [Bacteroidales bacterium]|nr:PorT family protein [Bacteroidales bacterium]